MTLRRRIIQTVIFCVLPLTAWADNASLLNFIHQRARATGSDSLVVVENGKILLEDYFGQTDRVRSVQSVTKSIAALAIGMLLEEGRISSLDEPMSTWIPQWSKDPEKSKISLRMVMSHTAGLPITSDDFFTTPDIVETAANTPLVTHPGTMFQYSNLGAALLQPVITQASGESVEEFLHRRLFKPLHITDFQWAKDSRGHERTSGGLFLSTADLLKIGEMMLNEGRYQSTRILNAETVRLLTTRSQPFSDYGLLWWLESPKELAAFGWGGQQIVVYREKKLLAVRTKDPASVDEAKLSEQRFRDFRELFLKWE